MSTESHCRTEHGTGKAETLMRLELDAGRPPVAIGSEVRRENGLMYEENIPCPTADMRMFRVINFCSIVKLIAVLIFTLRFLVIK